MAVPEPHRQLDDELVGGLGRDLVGAEEGIAHRFEGKMAEFDGGEGLSEALLDGGDVIPQRGSQGR